MMRWMILSGVFAALALGCAGQPEHAELGRKFLLKEEPAGAMGVVDYHETEPKASDVTLVGRVGFETLKWSKQSAMFVLNDPAESMAGGGHVCNDENCPFCKGKQGTNHSQAIVMLVGDDGQVPPLDARKMLPVTEGQMAVVSGKAEIDQAGQLVVQARGIYLRR